MNAIDAESPQGILQTVCGPPAEPHAVAPNADATRNALSTADRCRLAQLEDIVEKGRGTFLEVGRALMEIRDSRLYLERYATFEAYCKDRWGFTARRAGQIMLASDQASPARRGRTRNRGSEELPSLPVRNQRQARELARVPDEQRAVVWREAIDRTGGRPTAAVLKTIIDETLSTANGDGDAAATAASHSSTDNETGIEKAGEPGSAANAGEKGGVQSRQGNGSATPVVDVQAEPPRQPSAEVPTSLAAADVQSPPTATPDEDQAQYRTPAEMKARSATRSQFDWVSL